MKKLLRALIKTTAGKILLTIHLEIFIDFLKERAKVKYGVANQRYDFVANFLDSLQKDVEQFIEMDFLEVKNSKDIDAAEQERKNKEYLAAKELLKNAK